MQTIRLSLGMPLLQVETANGIRLPLQGLSDDSPVVIESPVRIGYAPAAGQAGAFDLPPTAMAWIGQRAGTVVDLSWAPQTSALAIQDVRQLAAETTQVVGRAEWRVAGDQPAPLPTIGTLEELFRQRPPGRLFAYAIGTWHLGATTLGLTLNELFLDGSSGAEPLAHRRFLLNIHISDRTVRTEARARMLARRRELGRPETDALPLSAWVGAR